MRFLQRFYLAWTSIGSKRGIKALRYAAFSGAHRVSVVFDGKAMIGSRVRKVRTHSYNAFSSVDYPELAEIKRKRIIPFIEPEYGEKPQFFHQMNPKQNLHISVRKRKKIMLFCSGMHCFVRPVP